MISGSSLCSSFKLQLLLGVHNFQSDTFMVALYDDDAPLSPDTTVYFTDGEISGPGYTAGGQALTGVQILGPAAGVTYVTFNDPIWAAASLTARGALIYNQSKAQNSVAVLDFGSDQTSNNGSFRMQFPPPGPTTALIRIM
jgi:hypothetical protein